MNLQLEHYYRMTDSTGMIQHSKYSIPDLQTGYTTDDNARALISTCMLYKHTQGKEYIDQISKFLSFLFYGQNENGRWKNFMDYQRKFIEFEGSEDSFGRSLWALGVLVSTPNIPIGIIAPAELMLRNATKNIRSLQAVRALCYSLIGLCLSYKSEQEIISRKLIEDVADIISQKFKNNATDDWYWFDEMITYANGIVPYSLFCAYEAIEKNEYLDIAFSSLSFLDKIVLKDGYLKLIGCKGWAPKGVAPAEYDEQPIDALDMILAYTQAYRMSNNPIYKDKANICFKWFHGENCHKLSLVCPHNGACHDGLTKIGLNLNQGAESILAYIISYLTLEELYVQKTLFDN